MTEEELRSAWQAQIGVEAMKATELMATVQDPQAVADLLLTLPTMDRADLLFFGCRTLCALHHAAKAAGPDAWAEAEAALRRRHLDLIEAAELDESP